jgi:hypothetical protein
VNWRRVTCPNGKPSADYTNGCFSKPRKP